MSLLAWLKILFVAIGVFLAPFIRQFLTDIGIALAEAAMEAVQAVADSGLSGEEKRKEAFRLIYERLKAKGIEVSSSLINGAIEAAVAKLKSKEVV